MGQVSDRNCCLMMFAKNGSINMHDGKLLLCSLEYRSAGDGAGDACLAF